jgi:hypothetical protein
MKKEIRKKLVLNKTTISNLDKKTQGAVMAGYISATCPDAFCDTARTCTAGCPSIVWQYCCPEDTTVTGDPGCLTLNSYCPPGPCDSAK